MWQMVRRLLEVDARAHMLLLEGEQPFWTRSLRVGAYEGVGTRGTDGSGGDL